MYFSNKWFKIKAKNIFMDPNFKKLTQKRYARVSFPPFSWGTILPLIGQTAHGRMAGIIVLTVWPIRGNFVPHENGGKLTLFYTSYDWHWQFHWILWVFPTFLPHYVQWLQFHVKSKVILVLFDRNIRERSSKKMQNIKYLYTAGYNEWAKMWIKHKHKSLCLIYLASSILKG